MRLQALAPAKVNLALFMGTRGEAGYHRLVTLYESISLADRLIAESLEPSRHDEVVCPGVRGENLVARALAALRQEGWDGPPLRIQIIKRIPVAGGMGGGSADAAAALRLALAFAPGPADALEAIAAQLGADVPAQLQPGLALGTGLGERVTRLTPLAEHAYAVVPVDAQLATADVYAEADRLGLGRTDLELERLQGALEDATLQGAPELRVNDLQTAATSLCPQTVTALRRLDEAGAPTAMVSGSGPTVFGLCWGADARPAATELIQRLVTRYPGATVAVPVDAGFGAPRLL
jgi:4-diphosphocytidyl-2-C-methyl-D-erythritol kinase